MMTGLWSSELLAAQPGLRHAMTMAGTNISLTGGPDRAHAAAVRQALCEGLGLSFTGLTVARQVHGCEVLPVDRDMIGAGRETAEDAIPHVDGLCTDQAGVPLLGISADCPLVLLYDPGVPALGIAHAGWRGAVAGIASRLVAQMQMSFGARASRMWAAIAPSAGPCCYEIRMDVERVVRARWSDPGRYLLGREGRTVLDLWSLNRDQLVAGGVAPDHIDLAGVCTICDHRFCSYRREGGLTRFAGLLAGIA
jgi:YfiH family protein